MPQLLHAGLQAALDRLAERHPAGVRRAARNLVSGTRSVPLAEFAAYCVAGPRAAARPRRLQMYRMLALACVLAAFALAAGSASAQQPSGTSQQPAPTPPYGPPITLEQAKRVMAAAELEAAKNSWQVAVTILDSGGNMVMFRAGFKRAIGLLAERWANPTSCRRTSRRLSARRRRKRALSRGCLCSTPRAGQPAAPS